MNFYLMRVECFDFENTQNVILWAVFAATVISFLIQLYYYLFIFRKAGLKPRKGITEHVEEPVSIIICVKDDGDNLSKILPLLLEQNYPEYEVVVVDANSSDDSEEILKLAATRYPHLQVRSLVANNSVYGKSIVLGVGIKAAKYDRLIITDVACRPSANWLKAVSTGFGSAIVAGYTRYTATGKFVRIANYYESLFRLGYALKKRPYTASGENASFRKELFFDKGFNPLLRKPEKVEEVFFNSTMNKKNTAVVLLPDAIVESAKTLSFDNWRYECSVDMFSQRLFRKGSRCVKLTEIISKTVFYLSFAAAIVMTADVMWMWFSIAGMFLLRLMIQILVFTSTQKRLGEKNLVIHTLFWDLYSIGVYLNIAMLVRHRKTIKFQ
jgi:glycosyltransferase involved in cell wall biosynthesis